MIYVVSRLAPSGCDTLRRDRQYCCADSAPWRAPPSVPEADTPGQSRRSVSRIKPTWRRPRGPVVAPGGSGRWVSPYPSSTRKAAERTEAIKTPDEGLPEITQKGWRLIRQISLPCNKPTCLLSGRVLPFFPRLPKNETSRPSQEACFFCERVALSPLLDPLLPPFRL